MNSEQRFFERVKSNSGVWYLATPYTNYEKGEESAYRAAVRSQAYLLAYGVTTFCPIAHGHPAAKFAGSEVPRNHDFWMEQDKKYMDQCCGLIVVTMPGWAGSKGVRFEKNYMYGRGVDVVYLNFGDVEKWANGADAPTQSTGPLTCAERFDAALATLTQDRGMDYGHPFDDFGIAAILKGAIRECPDDRLRHALEMIAVKMARLVTSPDHFDSWADIAGYARTACMVIDRRKEHEQEF